MKSFVSLKSGASNAHDVEICTTFALYLNIRRCEVRQLN